MPATALVGCPVPGGCQPIPPRVALPTGSNYRLPMAIQ